MNVDQNEIFHSYKCLTQLGKNISQLAWNRIFVESLYSILKTIPFTITMFRTRWVTWFTPPISTLAFNGNFGALNSAPNDLKSSMCYKDMNILKFHSSFTLFFWNSNSRIVITTNKYEIVRLKFEDFFCLFKVFRLK